MVASSQFWRCAICDCMLDFTYEVDHKRALYRSGSNDLSNLQARCVSCHRRKTVQEHRSELELRESAAQLRTRFRDTTGASVPLDLVRHVMARVHGWHPESVEEKLTNLSFEVGTDDVLFPAALWRSSFSAAGMDPVLKGRVVHGLSAVHLPKIILDPHKNKPQKKNVSEHLFEEFRFDGRNAFGM